MRTRNKERRHGMFGGLVLIALGVSFLLVQMGYLSGHFLSNWWTWWPAIMLAVGLVRLVRPNHAGDVGSGVMMILFGLWFFANQFEWWGLTWHTSWPMALVAVGAGIVARSIAATMMQDEDEKDKEKEAPNV